MTSAPLPPGVVARLGTTAFRLPERYGTVFLMPPHFSSYVASDAGALREYDLRTGEPGRVLLEPEPNTRFGGISADGKRVVVSAPAGYQVLRTADRQVLCTVPHEPGALGCELAPNGRRLAVLVRNPDTEQREADGDMEDVFIRAVVVHTVGPRSKRREFRPLLNFGLSAVLSPDARYLTVTGAWEEEYDDQPRPIDSRSVIQVWDVGTGREVFRHTPGDEDRDVTVRFGAGVLLVGSGYPFRPVALFDLPAGTLVHRYRRNTPSGHYTLSPDGRTLVGLIDTSHDLLRLDARTGTLIDRTPSPFGPPASSFFSANADRRTTHTLGVRADGTVAVLQSVEQTVLAWTAPDGEVLSRPVGGNVPVKAVTFTADGREVLTAGSEPVARRWGAQTGALLGEIELPRGMADRMALVRFPSPELLVTDSAFGGAEFNLRTRKARLRERSSFGEVAWEAFRSADGWVVEFWAADAEARRMSRGPSELRLGRLGDTNRRTLTAFESDWAAASYDRGRVLLVYDDRAGAQRTLMGFSATAASARREWVRHLPVGPEFTDTYEERRRVDSSKVGSILPAPAVLWAPDGATALVIPMSEQVPFLIDPATGGALGTWETAVRGPHAVHPSRPILATATPRGDGLVLADWRTGARLAVLMEQCYPHALAWSPDGARLAASGPDGTAWVFGLDAVDKNS
ncbi:MAG TPA: hypothetical protein VGE74_12045 [Gemmata sp.]